MAKLFLYVPELQATASAIADIWKIGVKEQKEVNTLSDIAKELDAYKSLEEVVLFTHGFAGGILIDDEAYNISDAKVAQAFAKTKTQIDHIRFEGCWIGEAPNDMAVFGGLFKAVDVSAFNWVHWSNEITVTIPKGTTADALQKMLKQQQIEPWLAPGTPPLAQLASMAQQGQATKKLLLEWFQTDLTDHPPFVDDNLKKLGRHSYQARSGATLRSVLAKNAKYSAAPRSPFEYVTVIV